MTVFFAGVQLGKHNARSNSQSPIPPPLSPLPCPRGGPRPRRSGSESTASTPSSTGRTRGCTSGGSVNPPPCRGGATGITTPGQPPPTLSGGRTAPRKPASVKGAGQGRHAATNSCWPRSDPPSGGSAAPTRSPRSLAGGGRAGHFGARREAHESQPASQPRRANS